MDNKNILFNKLIDRHKFTLEQLDNLVNIADKVIYREDGIICLINREEFNYLLVKSIDSTYSLGLLREAVKLILKSKMSLATTVEGESLSMRKVLDRLGFIEVEDDFYLLEK
jgi:hypothetical protein